MSLFDPESTKGVVFVMAAGAAIGLGQLLLSAEKLTWRIAIGRAIVSTGLALSGFTALAWVSGLPSTAILGISCLIASLGTSGLERMVQRLTSGAPLNGK